MLFKRINRTDPEQVFLVCRNDDSVAWIAGAPVCFIADGTRDGVDAIRNNTAAAAKQALLVGLADAATVAAEYGLVQCYGYRSNAVINQAGSASGAAGAVGDGLIQWTASNALSGASSGAAMSASVFLPYAVLMETIASSATIATVAGKVWLRCM